MYEQPSKPKFLRHRGVIIAESVLVLVAIVVSLFYLNQAPTPDAVVNNTDTQIAESSSTLAGQARQTNSGQTIDIDAIKEMAWQEVMNGKYEAAIAQYNLVLSINPDDFQALMERGITHARSGDHQRAIVDYSSAARLRRSNALVYYNRGISYDVLGMTAEAIADYDHSIRHDSLYPNVWNNRGYIYASLGNWSQAISDYSRAIDLNSLYATAYNNRGIAYTHIGEYEKAQADYDRAIELDPNYQDAIYNSGILKYKSGDYQAAMNAFHILIKSGDTDNAQLWNNHGSALHRLGQYANAISSYSEALYLDPNYELALRNRAAAYKDFGKYSEAIVDYSRLIEMNPDDASLYLARGNVYERVELSGNRAGADYMNWLQRFQNPPHTMQEVAEVGYRTEFEIKRNQFHQFSVFITEGEQLSFSAMSVGVSDVDPLLVVMQDNAMLIGNDDTDLTLNSALFGVKFEKTGWVHVYVGLAGAGSEEGTVSFSIQHAQ